MRKHGAAAVLAMIFLAVFGVLALAMLTMTNTATKIAANDRDGQVAAAATESGIAYVQRLVGDITLGGVPTGQQAMKGIYDNLAALNSSPALNNKIVLALPDSANPTSITIPSAGTLPIHPDGIQQFQAVIELASAADATKELGDLKLTVTGLDTRTNQKRTSEMILKGVDRMSEIFSYGVYSKGRVDLADGQADIIGNPPKAGSLGSAYTGDYAIYLNGGNVSGNIYVNGNPDTTFHMGDRGGTIGILEDKSDPQPTTDALKHVAQQAPPPFPDFHPNRFDVEGLTVINKDTARAAGGGGNLYRDCVITESVEFGGSDRFEGLIYIREGVTVTFKGDVTINAVIVVQDPNEDASGNPIAGMNVTSTSKLDFQGVPTFDTVYWSQGSRVAPDLQNELRGYSVLGPTAYIYMQGNAGGGGDKKSTFAASVVCGTLEQHGSGIVRIHNGALITMADSMTTGAKGFSSEIDGDGVLIDRDATYKAPIGGYSHQWSWIVDPRTYRERTRNEQ